MAATVMRRSNIPDILSIFDTARQERRHPPERRFRKFSKSNDKDNFVLTKVLGSKPVRLCFVAFHKPSLADTHIRKNHGNEYNYLTKFVIERISWAARDVASKGGDSKCALVFSHQDMYPLENLLEYIEKLQRGRGRFNTRANWEHISQVTSQPHENEGEMHIPDLCASSLFRAIEPREHGMTDERFLLNLLPRLYRGRNSKPHGLKIWPDSVIAKAQADGKMRFLAHS